MLLVRMLETVVKYIWKEKVIKVCLVLLVSARRMIQVMSGATDPRLQQLQVKRLKIFLFLNLMNYQLHRQM